MGSNNEHKLLNLYSSRESSPTPLLAARKEYHAHALLSAVRDARNSEILRPLPRNTQDAILRRAWAPLFLLRLNGSRWAEAAEIQLLAELLLGAIMHGNSIVI